MTIDDDSSIYVGGLPYDIGEESLRKVFYIYGAVLAVKIINDRSIGGKCYGFVTFANPRSATQAIKEMDGKTIDGRVVKVNEVRTRGGRPNFNRESSRRDLEKSVDGDNGRHRGRDDNHDRPRRRDGHRERSLDHDHDHDHDHDQNRERGHNRLHGHDRGHDRTRDRYVDGERFRNYNRHMEDVEQEHERKRERDWERDSDQNMEEQNNSHHRTGDKDQHQHSHLPNRSSFDDRGNREFSLESFNDDPDQLESKLAISNQKLEELRMQISQMDEMATDHQEVVSELQEKCHKLEDSLIMAKKVTSHRHLQLAKLHKCYLQVRDYNERLRNSEQELQSLVDSTMMELGNDGGFGDGILTNGRA